MRIFHPIQNVSAIYSMQKYLLCYAIPFHAILLYEQRNPPSFHRSFLKAYDTEKDIPDKEIKITINIPSSFKTILSTPTNLLSLITLIFLYENVPGSHHHYQPPPLALHPTILRLTPRVFLVVVVVVVVAVVLACACAMPVAWKVVTGRVSPKCRLERLLLF